MFDWYKNAELCSVYMEDCVQDVLEISDPKSSFARSRWFTRCWTLQELLAPRKALFFDSKWNEIGTRIILRKAISLITEIDIKALQYDYRKVQHDFSIAQKMSCAAKRQTTRIEDIAYCLLGIFSINMPIIYREGDNGFERLQLEITKFSDDQSLFAWQMHVSHKTKLRYWIQQWNEGLLAHHPRNFENSGAVKHGGGSVSSYSTTNRGIHIEIPPIEVPNNELGRHQDFILMYGLTGNYQLFRVPGYRLYKVFLNCWFGGSSHLQISDRLAIYLWTEDDEGFCRVFPGTVTLVDTEELVKAHKRRIYVRPLDTWRNLPDAGYAGRPLIFENLKMESGVHLVDYYPQESWTESEEQGFIFGVSEQDTGTNLFNIKQG